MSSQFNQRSLGKSSIKITPIGLGAWQFSEGKNFNNLVWKSIDSETTNEIISQAVKAGINWIDTAEYYGKGASERGVSRGLQAANLGDNDVKIATKWWPLLRFAKNIPRSISKRINALSPYSIDLYQIHQPFSFSSVEKQMQNMVKIANLNLIKSIGVSNFTLENMIKAYEELEKNDYPLVSNQVSYSILDRRIENNGLLEKANELGITIIAYSPLQLGLLSGKYHSDPSLINNLPMGRRRFMKERISQTTELMDLLGQISDETNMSVSQISLNWIISKNEKMVTIPGATKPHHAKESAETMNFKLRKEQIDTINELSQNIKF